MNYMPKVLEMLGVEVGEKFKVNGWDNSPYHFDESYNLANCFDTVINPRKLFNLLRGFDGCEIEKIPWKPAFGEKYWYVKEDGQIREKIWHGHDIAFYRYNDGNCFRTAEEITMGIKEKILREMRGKYEND